MCEGQKRLALARADGSLARMMRAFGMPVAGYSDREDRRALDHLHADIQAVREIEEPERFCEFSGPMPEGGAR